MRRYNHKFNTFTNDVQVEEIDSSENDVEADAQDLDRNLSDMDNSEIEREMYKYIPSLQRTTYEKGKKSRADRRDKESQSTRREKDNDDKEKKKKKKKKKETDVETGVSENQLQLVLRAPNIPLADESLALVPQLSNMATATGVYLPSYSLHDYDASVHVIVHVAEPKSTNPNVARIPCWSLIVDLRANDPDNRHSMRHRFHTTGSRMTGFHVQKSIKQLHDRSDIPLLDNNPYAYPMIELSGITLYAAIHWFRNITYAFTVAPFEVPAGVSRMPRNMTFAGFDSYVIGALERLSHQLGPHLSHKTMQLFQYRLYQLKSS